MYKKCLSNAVVYRCSSFHFQEKCGCIPHGLSEAMKMLSTMSEPELTREKVFCHVKRM